MKKTGGRMMNMMELGKILDDPTLVSTMDTIFHQHIYQSSPVGYQGVLYEQQPDWALVHARWHHGELGDVRGHGHRLHRPPFPQLGALAHPLSDQPRRYASSARSGGAVRPATPVGDCLCMSATPDWRRPVR